MQDIVMPKMGHDVTEGKLLRWTKSVGDAVAKGEIVAEIEADKVNLEIEAPVAGVLHALDVVEGAIVQVGARLGLVANADEHTSAAPPVPTSGASTPSNTPPPAPTPAPAFSSVALLDAPATASNGTGDGTPDGVLRSVRATPLARRLAEEHGVDLSRAVPTGPGGRVMRDDVLALAPGTRGANAGAPITPTPGVLTGTPGASLTDASLVPPPQAPLVAPIPALPVARPLIPAPDAANAGSVPLSRLQQTIARRMVESKTQAPHFYLTVEVDVTALLALRVQLNAAAEDGVRVSLNDLVIKATAKALTRFPVLNASFAGDHLVMHDEISIAIAVALDDGLVTPVVRWADQKALGQIAVETRGLAERARAGKSKPADYEGGTFTISNLGMFHVETFVAIINPPQVGILAVGAVKRTPVYEGDVLVPRDRMSMTLSADHRVTDGATGARFLSTIRTLLEHPMRILV